MPSSRGSGFEARLESLEASMPEDRNVAHRFSEVVRGLDDWGLVRINPLRFAQDWGFEPQQAIELFVRAAKTGLFDLEWNTLCPLCGSMEHSRDSLDRVESGPFHCTICDLDIPSDLDDAVGVWFTVNPGAAQVHVDPLESFAAYRRYFFSADVEPSSDQIEYSRWAVRGFAAVPSHGEHELAFEAEPGAVYRVLNAFAHSAAALEIGQGPARPQKVELVLGPGGLSPRRMTLAPGPVTLHLRNSLGQPGPHTLLRFDPRIHDILARCPPRVHPLLTAKMLLNCQVFRDQFRIQTLAPELQLRVRSLTLLFTDLKGSTSLYARAGDIQAFRLVREHFVALSAAVRANAGAVVKTMGDAIMASFSTPVDGARAAAEMMARIDELNRHAAPDERLGLKVGLHAGPALVVNAEDRLDYFGQTVNLAARVQGLSHAGEIHATETFEREPGVAAFFDQSGYAGERRSVSLKGVGAETAVLRYRRAG